jgi:hypothetical protein
MKYYSCKLALGTWDGKPYLKRVVQIADGKLKSIKSIRISRVIVFK